MPSLTSLPRLTLGSILCFSSASRLSEGRLPFTAPYFAWQLNHGDEPVTSLVVPLCDALLGLPLLVLPASWGFKVRRRIRITVSALVTVGMVGTVVMQRGLGKDWSGDAALAALSVMSLVGCALGPAR